MIQPAPLVQETAIQNQTFDMYSYWDIEIEEFNKVNAQFTLDMD